MSKTVLKAMTRNDIQNWVKRNYAHEDADTQMFYERELEHVMSLTYDIVYPDLMGRVLFPINRDVSPGAKTFTYYQYDRVGMGKIIANYGKDFPRASISKKIFTGNIREIGSSYAYSLKDLWAAKEAGLPLEVREADAAKMAVLQAENKVVFNGDSDNKLGGLLSNTNILISNPASDGTGASAKFVDKTPTQIIRDMNNLCVKIISTTLNTEKPDTLIMPPAQLAYIASTPYSTITAVTILKWFMDSNPWIKNVEAVNELAGAGSASKDVMVAFKRDPRKVFMVVPQDFLQLPPQIEGAEWTIPCLASTGGLVFTYPLSACRGEGI